MERYEEILKRLLDILVSESSFPVWIGPVNTGIACTDGGESFRIKGKTGKFFPTTEAAKQLGCTESEFIAAAEWVTRLQPDMIEINPGTFWFFLPKNVNNWPKE